MEIGRDRYLERLIAHKGNQRVKIVTGVRRCGKVSNEAKRKGAPTTGASSVFFVYEANADD